MKNYKDYINEEKKPEKTEKLPKLKNHFIIKDDINEFYFVNDEARISCGIEGKINKLFKKFKTDDDGAVLAECTNCKTKGLLLEHIEKIIVK